MSLLIDEEIVSKDDKIEGLSEKFSQDDWNTIEHKVGSYEQKVIDCLKLLGITDMCEVINEFNVFGEKVYLDNRYLLENPLQLVFPLVTEHVECEKSTSTKKEKKKKEKPLTSKEKIIMENNKIRAEGQIKNILKTFIGEFQPKYAFNSDVVEIKGIGLLYTGYYLFNNHLQYKNKKHLSFVFTVMVSIERYINNCQNLEGKGFTGKEKVSTTLLSDLKVWLDKLKTIYEYNGLVIYDNAPELLIYTEYDNAIPRAGVKPRNHQAEIMKKIKEYYTSGFWLAYNAMIGSGKTCVVVAIGNYIKETVRKLNPLIQLIFACNLPSVRDHAANLCYNAGIQFGVGCKNNTTGKYQIINHYSCLKNENRIVIITSPEVAYDILRDDTTGNNAENYMVFHDEPTVCADNKNSETLKINMMLLSIAPKRLILSSATLPDIEYLPNIISYFKRKYSTIIVDTVYSSDIQIGCDVKTFDFKPIVPHLGVKNQTHLKEAIKMIQKNPFLSRMYTPDIVRLLCENMANLKIQNLPNIIEIFQNVDNVRPNNIRSIAINLLEILAKESDKTIEEICSITRESKIILEEKKTEMNFFEQDEESNSDNTLDFKKLATSQAWIMQNTTLIASVDPMQFMEENFLDFVKNEIYKFPLNISDEGVIQYYKNTKNVLKIYEKELNNIQKQQEAFENGLGKTSKKMAVDTKGKKCVEIDEHEKINKDNYDKKKQEFMDVATRIQFPDFGHINSKAHFKKYAKISMRNIQEKNIRYPLSLEAIPFKKIDVRDELLTMLFAGIGGYTMYNKEICNSYFKHVLEMASLGQLAYIIGDVSICYGTDYPINKIIVTNEFAEKHSIYTLFQLFGRAGRVGRSWNAYIYIPESVAERIMKYAQNPTKEIVEATNMEEIFCDCIKQTTTTDSITLNAILQKYLKRQETVSVSISVNIPKRNQNHQDSGMTFIKNRVGPGFSKQHAKHHITNSNKGNEQEKPNQFDILKKKKNTTLEIPLYIKNTSSFNSNKSWRKKD